MVSNKFKPGQRISYFDHALERECTGVVVSREAAEECESKFLQASDYPHVWANWEGWHNPSYMPENRVKLVGPDPKQRNLPSWW